MFAYLLRGSHRESEGTAGGQNSWSKSVEWGCAGFAGVVDSSLLLRARGSQWKCLQYQGLDWTLLAVGAIESFRAGQGHDHRRREDTVPLLEPGAEFLLGHRESSRLYLKRQVGLLGAGDRGLGSCLWAQRPARPHHILTSPFLLAKKTQGLVRASC